MNVERFSFDQQQAINEFFIENGVVIIKDILTENYIKDFKKELALIISAYLNKAGVDD